MSTHPGFPQHLRRLVCDLLAAGGRVTRDGLNVFVDGPEKALPAIIALRARADELAANIIPSVTPEEAAVTRELLADAGAEIAYVVDREMARTVCGEISASQPEVIGLDFETEAFPEFRQPMPVRFTQLGTPAARQPRSGASGAALCPFRSKVRLVQAWAGGEKCYIFDMRAVDWSDISPLFAHPLAIFNASFELKRLIHEAGVEPTGHVFDVMTAHWLTDGVRPSLEEAARINYGLEIPKTLGASDWSADSLSQEQLEYAALDAVLCRLLWLTQQDELFDDADKQCQQLADNVTPAVARMELHGMPIDVAAHRAQMAKWLVDLAEAQEALRAASPMLDLERPTNLQQHLHQVLDDEALGEWPRTDSGKLVARRQQLELNAHLPGISDLLKVRTAQKMIGSFGDNLIEAVNPVTGRLHASFLVAGASTGRFSARGPNLQQMPKSRQKDFRKIFAAPPGHLVMALDYSQIELRVVAELISDWFGDDSILRKHFAAGLDAHTATAMSMTGKTNPEDVTKQERQLAKPCNFGLLYRMGDVGFYNYLRANFMPDVTFEEARELKSKFFKSYPDLASWQDEYSRVSREAGFTQTALGRRWRWKWRARDPEELDEDEPFYADRLSGFRGSYAVNHPVQGSSAELLMIALARLDKALRSEPAQLIATVHDEAVLLVPDKSTEVDRIGALARQEMVAAFLDVYPDGPTLNLVDVGVGPTWGDLQPLAEWVVGKCAAPTER